MTYQEILSRFRVAKQGTDSAQAFCPVHNGGNEKHPSLTISNKNGKTLLYCHVCGREGTAAILEAVGMKMSDLMPENRSGKTLKQFAEYRGGQFVESYDYSGESGYAYTKCRVLMPDGSKKFLFCRTDICNHVIEYKVPDRQQYKALYPFKALQAARDDNGVILYVEGEKDASRASADGFHAITSGGANDWTDDLVDYFKGLNVIVVPDNDEPGIASAKKIAQAMTAKGIAVKMIRWDEGFQKKGDYSDFIESFQNRAAGITAFKRKIEEAEEPEDPEGLAFVYGQDTFFDADADFDSIIPKTPWLIEGILAEGETALLSGASKAGKSYLATQIAVCAAMGLNLFDRFKCRPISVLYLNAENVKNDARGRLQKIERAMHVDPNNGKKIRTFCVDGKFEPINKIKNSLLHDIRKFGYGLIIIDPLYCFYEGSEVDEQDAKQFVTTLKDICRETGVGIICIHHHSKGGQAFYSNASSRASGSGMLQRAFSDLLDLSEIRDNKLQLPEDVRAFQFNGEIRQSSGFNMNILYEYPLWKADTKCIIPDNAANKARTAAAREANRVFQKSEELKRQLPKILAEAFKDPLCDTMGDYTTINRVITLFEKHNLKISKATIRNYFNDGEECTRGYVRDKRNGHKEEIRKQEFTAASSVEQEIFNKPSQAVTS